MATAKINIDDLASSSFHKRISFVASGGPLCDGYLLGIIVVALPLIAAQLHLNAFESGLIGASSLIGMFFGGLVFGPMTDKFGRQSMYVLNLAVFLICSIAHLFVGNVVGLIALRLIMGIALGADYPIATALACEFLPTKMRGPVLSGLVFCFWIGFIASLCVGFFIPPDSGIAWRLILASAAIPSGVFLLMRLNVPESPRWLISAGKTEKAREVVNRYLGDNVDFERLVRETPKSVRRKGVGLSSIRELFARGYGPALLFCAVFWTCQIAPSLAIKTFQPMLLAAFGIQHSLGGTILIISFATIGTAIGTILINKLGRRVLLLRTFLVSTVALILLGTPVSGVAWAAIACFILFTLSEAAGSALQFVYPNEVFPTDLRATGMGLAMSISRVGSAVGTFLMPVTISSLGRSNALIISGGICFVGLIVAFFMAPETKGLSLSDSATVRRSTAPVPVGAKPRRGTRA